MINYQSQLEKREDDSVNQRAEASSFFIENNNRFNRHFAKEKKIRYEGKLLNEKVERSIHHQAGDVREDDRRN